MGRRSAAWLVTLPLIAAGSWSAHGVAYWLVAPDGGERGRLLAETGHGYLEHAPLALAALAAVLLAGLAGRIAGAARGESGKPLATWPFLLVPFFGFALQEHLERLLAGAPAVAAVEPTFLLGLALQLPFALLAWAIAISLLATSERLGRALAERPPAGRSQAVEAPRMPLGVDAAKPCVLEGGLGVRGPPSSLPFPG